MKNKKLCWNVYHFDWNEQETIVKNIFELNWPMNARLYELRNYTDKEKFAKELDSEIKYELWARSQYEFGVCENFPCIEAKELERLNKEAKENPHIRYNVEIAGMKTDPYQQVKMNWEQFVDYCWENKKLFRQFKKANKTLKELYNERYKKNR